MSCSWAVASSETGVVLVHEDHERFVPDRGQFEFPAYGGRAFLLARLRTEEHVRLTRDQPVVAAGRVRAGQVVVDERVARFVVQLNGIERLAHCGVDRTSGRGTVQPREVLGELPGRLDVRNYQPVPFTERLVLGQIDLLAHLHTYSRGSRIRPGLHDLGARNGAQQQVPTSAQISTRRPAIAAASCRAPSW